MHQQITYCVLISGFLPGHVIVSCVTVGSDLAARSGLGGLAAVMHFTYAVICRAVRDICPICVARLVHF